MIVEWIVSVGSGFASWVASLFPVLELPEWFTGVDELVNDVFGYGDGLGAWIDWPIVVPILVAPLAIWALALGVRAARALIAHIPFLGGKG